MLLFTDGFERFHFDALHLKWPVVSCYAAGSGCSIVGGTDSKGKPHARKDGRALRVGHYYTTYQQYERIAIGTTVRKSRQLFCGFAFKTYEIGGVFTVNFYSRTPQRRALGGIQSPGRYPVFPIADANSGNYNANSRICIPGTSFLVSTLECTISSAQKLTVKWRFRDSANTTKISEHNVNGSLVNGDFRYFQCALSVVGGDENPPHGWCETRLGNRGIPQRFDDVRIVDFGSSYGYYLDLVTFGICPKQDNPSASITVDDFYICNDEGDVNNDFLGNCIVRSVVPEIDGYYNQSTPINGGPSRTGCVSSDFFGIGEMPIPIPDPATNPEFIPWEKPLDSYLRLSNQEDKQSFKFSNANFAGSEPVIYGTMIHSVVKTLIANYGKTSITPFFHIDNNVYYGNQEHFPLTADFSARYLCFDNKDLANIASGFVSPVFNTVALSGVDAGFSLSPAINNLYFSSPAVVRYNITYDVVVYDSLPISDFCHRHIDEYLTASFNSHDDSDYEKTFAIYDYFQIGIIDVVSRANYFWISDNVIYSSYLPMIDEIIVDGLSFDSDSFVVYETYIESSLSFDTWITTKPVESVSDYFMFLSALSISHGESVFSDISLDLFIEHNFEDVESPLDIVVSYIFSGHEFADDYLDIDDFSVGAHVVLVGDDIVFTDWHFNGHHVEEFREQFSLTDSVLTQHWRHEFIFFVCIASWQIEPIEQPGNDGNRVGQLTSQIEWYNSLM